MHIYSPRAVCDIVFMFTGDQDLLDAMKQFANLTDQSRFVTYPVDIFDTACFNSRTAIEEQNTKL